MSVVKLFPENPILSRLSPRPSCCVFSFSLGPWLNYALKHSSTPYSILPIFHFDRCMSLSRRSRRIFMLDRPFANLGNGFRSSSFCPSSIYHKWRFSLLFSAGGILVTDLCFLFLALVPTPLLGPEWYHLSYSSFFIPPPLRRRCFLVRLFPVLFSALMSELQQEYIPGPASALLPVYQKA